MRQFCQVQYRHKINFSPLKTAFHFTKGNVCVTGRGVELPVKAEVAVAASLVLGLSWPPGDTTRSPDEKRWEVAEGLSLYENWWLVFFSSYLK